MTTISSNFDATCEEKTLSHVAQYRMTVREALARVVTRPQGSVNSARRQLNRLIQDGLLTKAALFRNRPYYHLTEKGADRIGYIGGFGPLSELAKIRAYAMLSFCCLHEVPRERLTQEDFNTHFSSLYRPGMPMNYYVDSSGPKPRLGFLRVDMGGHGRWDRIVAKARHDVQQHAASGPFHKLIQDRALEVTVVTPLPQKARRIWQMLLENQGESPIEIRVVSIPNLLHLVLPPPVQHSQ